MRRNLERTVPVLIAWVARTAQTNDADLDLHFDAASDVTFVEELSDGPAVGISDETPSTSEIIVDWNFTADLTELALAFAHEFGHGLALDPPVNPPPFGDDAWHWNPESGSPPTAQYAAPFLMTVDNNAGNTFLTKTDAKKFDGGP